MNALKQNLFNAIDFLIRIESGPDAGKAYRIQPPKIVIGRDPQKCQVALSDPKASREQCAIKFSHNVICEDLSSRKTTTVNGQACGKETVLKPGDKIAFGQTVILFQARANEKAQPQLKAAEPSSQDIEKQKGRKQFQMFLAIIAVMIVAVLLMEDEPVATESATLATVDDLNQQIESSEERMTLMREAHAEKQKLSDKNHLYNVENHFIVGFRDFQNQRYGRALESFGTTLSVDNQHTRAQLYSKTARKKREDLIDTHLRDGQKYREKMMYNRCAAEYEKAIILINNKNSKKYELATTGFEECRLLKTGGYQ